MRKGKKKDLISRIKGHIMPIETGLRYLLSPGKRMTLCYPFEILELPTNYRGMIKLNMKACIGCAFCARICPANAIKMYKRGDKRYPGINYLRCVFCGFCVDICPVNALEATKVHDAAFATLGEHIFPPEKMAKPVELPFKKKPRIVRIKFDEKRGLIYEPVSD